MMAILLRQILNDLSITSVKTLIAMGLTLIFGLAGIINFAYGEFLMVGSIVTWLAVFDSGDRVRGRDVFHYGKNF